MLGSGVDTVLHAEIVELALRHSSVLPSGRHPDLNLLLTVEAGLRDRASGRTLFRRSYSVSLGPHKLEDWAERNATHWDRTLSIGISRVAELIIDELLLTRAPPSRLDRRPPGSTLAKRRIGSRRRVRTISSTTPKTPLEMGWF